MLSKNIETFLCCDSGWEEAGHRPVRRPLRLHHLLPARLPGLAARLSAGRATAWRATAPTRTGTCWTLPSSTAGDIELPFGDPALALSQIEERAAAILQAGKRPFLLGGEHLVTLGAFRAAFRKYPDIRVLHFDAHADLREDYLGVQLSHACVLRRCWELCGDGKIFQFGIRSGDRRSSAGARTTSAPTSST